jgi:hypothetical protein
VHHEMALAVEHKHDKGSIAETFDENHEKE